PPVSRDDGAGRGPGGRCAGRDPDAGKAGMKVADIRPDALMAGQQAAMLRDVAMLLDRRAEFVEVPCPACGDAASSFLYEKYGMAHRRCGGCATQYVSPRPSPAVLR